MRHISREGYQQLRKGATVGEAKSSVGQRWMASRSWSMEIAQMLINNGSQRRRGSWLTSV